MSRGTVDEVALAAAKRAEAEAAKRGHRLVAMTAHGEGASRTFSFQSVPIGRRRKSEAVQAEGPPPRPRRGFARDPRETPSQGDLF